MLKTKTQIAIDDAHIQRQGTGFRNHLGASIIGRPCSRSLWYVFRWAKRSRFPARVLRLFERGHAEEHVIASRLRKAGIHVLTENPDTGEQFRIEDHDGHFGGSLDAALYDTPDFPKQWILGEFKTHNDKSFKQLRKQGLEKSKYEHLVQTQIYMHYTQMQNALYFAVNKNDDDMEIISVEYDPGVAERFIDRAVKIILENAPPNRIPNASKGWWVCRFCDYKGICHDGDAKAMNCRTCVHSRPIRDAKWTCLHHRTELSPAAQRVGCDHHTPIPEE